MDTLGRIKPGKDTPRVNLEWLKELLLSKDMSRESELDWVQSEGYRFLDGKNTFGNMAALQSPPRSGNTFFRRTFEDITGIISGGGMSAERSYNEVMMGLLGTGITSNSNLVWITKTHCPMKTHFSEEDFKA